MEHALSIRPVKRITAGIQSGSIRLSRTSKSWLGCTVRCGKMGSSGDWVLYAGNYEIKL